MPPAFAALIGLDRGDRLIDWALINQADGSTVACGQVPNRPEALLAWVLALQARFGGAPIAIAMEQPAAALLEFLRGFGFITLFALNPHAVAAYRLSHKPSRSKNDALDAEMVGGFLRDRLGKLQPHCPDTVLTRTVAALVRHRRGLVDLRTQLTNQLTALLKGYYPQALELVGEDLHSALAIAFLHKWPTFQALSRARAETIRQFYHAHRCVRKSAVDKRLALIAQSVPLSDDQALLHTEPLLMRALLDQIEALGRSISTLEAQLFEAYGRHPDAFIFESLPASGRIHCARLLAAFGSQRERFPTAGSILTHSGIAPIVYTSGHRKEPRTIRRKACPTFLKQSLHEWAAQSIPHSLWAQAYYRHQRSKGKAHHTAVRALAYKWIRIIHRMWLEKTRYNEAAYLETLRKKGSPLIQLIDQLIEEKNRQCA